MRDISVLLQPQDEAITSDLTLLALWTRIHEDLSHTDFASGMLNKVRPKTTRISGIDTFVGLQLDEDPESTPKGYTNGSDIVPLMSG